MPIQAFRGVISDMHIVHVVQLYHPVASGSVRYFVEISKRLAAAGHRVTVLTTTAHDLESLWQANKRTFVPGYDSMRDAIFIASRYSGSVISHSYTRYCVGCYLKLGGCSSRYLGCAG
jgi:hypothetical protein